MFVPQSSPTFSILPSFLNSLLPVPSHSHSFHPFFLFFFSSFPVLFLSFHSVLCLSLPQGILSFSFMSFFPFFLIYSPPSFLPFHLTFFQVLPLIAPLFLNFPLPSFCSLLTSFLCVPNLPHHTYTHTLTDALTPHPQLEEMQKSFTALGNLIAEFPELAANTRFIFVPGPSDPGPSTIFPRLGGRRLRLSRCLRVSSQGVWVVSQDIVAPVCVFVVLSKKGLSGKFFGTLSDCCLVLSFSSFLPSSLLNFLPSESPSFLSFLHSYFSKIFS